MASYTRQSCKRFILISLVVAAKIQLTLGDQGQINLHMPEVRPTHDESYLCTSRRVNPSNDEYIIGFEPNASASRVHHVLIYGCQEPGKFVRDSPSYVWECGEMNQIESDDGETNLYENGPTCHRGGRSVILFAWALDAPAIDLPSKVGFKIGGESGINYLVLQVHYASVALFKKDRDLTDSSGIILHTAFGENHGITKLAGIYLLFSIGAVSTGVSKHTMECTIDEDKVIHPFRFRTHTHKLGVKVGAYKYPVDEPSREIIIGEHDPQKPQMFYPIQDAAMTIRKGDRIMAYCDYNNTRDQVVRIGPTGNDEMCNFYLMYWTDEKTLISKSECMGYNT